MKTYNQYSSNYLINIFKYIIYKPIIDELIYDLEKLKFTLPKSSMTVEYELLNLPLIKNIIQLNGINKVQIIQKFNQVHTLKKTILQNYRYIFTKLTNLDFDSLYYYSRFNWYLNSFNTDFVGIGSIAGTNNIPSLPHPILVPYLQKIIPLIIPDNISLLTNIINLNLSNVHVNLESSFNEFIIANKSSIVDKLSTYLITNTITLTPYYSNDLKLIIDNIVLNHINEIPPLTIKINKEKITNLISIQQTNELTLNSINNINLPINSIELFLDYKSNNPYLTNEGILNFYLKQFNNQIANNILSTNNETSLNLQTIIGQFKNNPEFFLNSFSVVYNLALDSLKSNFTEQFLPPNFTNDILKLIFDNLNTSIDISNYRNNESSLIKSCINKYLLGVINAYILNPNFTEFILSLLNKLIKYNLQAPTYLYPVQQYFKMLLFQYITNDILFNSIVSEFIQLYSNTPTPITSNDMSQKIIKAKVITSYNSQYYDDEIFNFFFNSVSHSIVDSLLAEYMV